MKADRDGAADKNRAAETVKEMLSDDTGGGDPGYAECRARSWRRLVVTISSRACPRRTLFPHQKYRTPCAGWKNQAGPGHIETAFFLVEHIVRRLPRLNVVLRYPYPGK